VIRKWGLLLVAGWVGITVLVALAAWCGLVIGLTVANDPHGS
jgi:hypothetical protein